MSLSDTLKAIKSNALQVKAGIKTSEQAKKDINKTITVKPKTNKTTKSKPKTSTKKSSFTTKGIKASGTAGIPKPSISDIFDKPTKIIESAGLDVSAPKVTTPSKPKSSKPSSTTSKITTTPEEISHKENFVTPDTLFPSFTSKVFDTPKKVLDRAKYAPKVLTKEGQIEWAKRQLGIKPDTELTRQEKVDRAIKDIYLEQRPKQIEKELVQTLSSDIISKPISFRPGERVYVTWEKPSGETVTTNIKASRIGNLETEISNKYKDESTGQTARILTIKNLKGDIFYDVPSTEQYRSEYINILKKEVDKGSGYIPSDIRKSIEIPDYIKELDKQTPETNLTETYIQDVYTESIGKPDAVDINKIIEQSTFGNKEWMENYAKFKTDSGEKTFKQLKKDEPALFVEKDKSTGLYEIVYDPKKWSELEHKRAEKEGDWGYLAGEFFSPILSKEVWLKTFSPEGLPSTTEARDEQGNIDWGEVFTLRKPLRESAAEGFYQYSKLYSKGDVLGIAGRAVQTPIVSVPLSFGIGSGIGAGFTYATEIAAGSKLGTAAVMGGQAALGGVSGGLAAAELQKVATERPDELGYTLFNLGANIYGGMAGYKTGQMFASKHPISSIVKLKPKLVWQDESGKFTFEKTGWRPKRIELKMLKGQDPQLVYESPSAFRKQIKLLGKKFSWGKPKDLMWKQTGIVGETGHLEDIPLLTEKAGVYPYEQFKSPVRTPTEPTTVYPKGEIIKVGGIEVTRPVGTVPATPTEPLVPSMGQSQITPYYPTIAKTPVIPEYWSFGETAGFEMLSPLEEVKLAATQRAVEQSKLSKLPILGEKTQSDFIPVKQAFKDVKDVFKIEPITEKTSIYRQQLQKVPPEQIPGEFIEKGIGQAAQYEPKVETIDVVRTKKGDITGIKTTIEQKPFAAIDEFYGQLKTERPPEYPTPKGFKVEEIRTWGEEITPTQYARKIGVEITKPKYEKAQFGSMELYDTTQAKFIKTYGQTIISPEGTAKIEISPYAPKTKAVATRLTKKLNLQQAKEEYITKFGKQPTKKELNKYLEEFLKDKQKTIRDLKERGFTYEAGQLEESLKVPTYDDILTHELIHLEKQRLPTGEYKGLTTKQIKDMVGTKEWTKMQKRTRKLYPDWTKEKIEIETRRKLIEDVVGLETGKLEGIKKPFAVFEPKDIKQFEMPGLFKGKKAPLKGLTIEEIDVGKLEKPKTTKILGRKVAEPIKETPYLKMDRSLENIGDMYREGTALKIPGVSETVKPGEGIFSGKVTKDVSTITEDFLSPKQQEIQLGKRAIYPEYKGMYTTYPKMKSIEELIQTRYVAPKKLEKLEVELGVIQNKIKEVLKQDRELQTKAQHGKITREEFRKLVQPVHDKYDILYSTKQQIKLEIAELSTPETGFTLPVTKQYNIGQEVDVIDKLIDKHKTKIEPTLQEKQQYAVWDTEKNKYFNVKQAELESQFRNIDITRRGDIVDIPKTDLQTVTEVRLKDIRYIPGIGSYVYSKMPEYIQRRYLDTGRRSWVEGTGENVKVIPEFQHPNQYETKTVIEWMKPTKIPKVTMDLLNKPVDEMMLQGRLDILGDLTIDLSRYVGKGYRIGELPVTLRQGQTLDVVKMKAYVAGPKNGPKQTIIGVGTTTDLDLQMNPSKYLKGLTKEDAKAIIMRHLDEMEFGRVPYDIEPTGYLRQQAMGMQRYQKTFGIPEQSKIPSVKELIEEQSIIAKGGEPYLHLKEPFEFKIKGLDKTVTDITGSKEYGPWGYMSESKLTSLKPTEIGITGKAKSVSQLKQKEGVSKVDKDTYFARTKTWLEQGEPKEGYGLARIQEDFVSGEQGLLTTEQMDLILRKNLAFKPPVITLDIDLKQIKTPKIPKGETKPKALKGEEIQQKVFIGSKDYQPVLSDKFIQQTGEKLKFELKIPEGKGFEPRLAFEKPKEVSARITEEKGIRTDIRTQRITGMSREDFKKLWQEAQNELRHENIIDEQIAQQLYRQGTKQIGKQTQNQISRQISENISRQINSYISRQTGKQIPEQINKQLNKQLEKQIQKQIQKQISKQIQKQIPKEIPLFIPMYIPPFIPAEPEQIPPGFLLPPSQKRTKKPKPFLDIKKKKESKKEIKRKKFKAFTGYKEKEYIVPFVAEFKPPKELMKKNKKGETEPFIKF